jgi:ElaB/YqjD/DUF883 family membrane-anchored ribosome-binding protein
MTVEKKTKADHDESADELRSDVEQTRERLASDVSALGEKLSSDNLKAEAKQAIKKKVKEGTDHVKDQVREGASHVREQVVEASEQVRETVTDAARPVASFVRENAVPLALIGAGIGWMLWSAKSKSTARPHDYAAFGRSEVYDAADYEEDGGFASRAERKLESVSDRARDGMRSARRAASHTAELARDRALQARGLAEQTLDERPLLLGAVALGAGLAVGLGLPATESENQLVGQYRDRLLSKGKERAQELGRAASNAVETAKGGFKEELAERAPV